MHWAGVILAPAQYKQLKGYGLNIDNIPLLDGPEKREKKLISPQLLFLDYFISVYDPFILFSGCHLPGNEMVVGQHLTTQVW